MRRPAFLVALLGAAAVLFRRRSRARRAEADLWTEAAGPAAGAPDLR